ncbi:MAG: transcription antitermination factor NusB [Candidatus Zixiibacteriota bacterium]|nr:MAG: transcription antitermination factor NusB [candidate division Zixibacteria bacterium]
MSSRHRAREYVLKALYAYEVESRMDEDVFAGVTERSGLDENDLAFARALYDCVVNNLKDIDLYIQQLATNWNLERIAVVDKNILRIAIGEAEFMPDIPIKVAINEAIELAKRYSTMESASFVNGILDRVLREREPEE